MRVRVLSWLPAFLFATLIAACDRAVIIRGKIVGEGGSETGECTAQLLARELDGVQREWTITNEFDQPVLVDPIRRLRYYLRIRCSRCQGSYQSAEFVEGAQDFGTIRLDSCDEQGC